MNSESKMIKEIAGLLRGNIHKAQLDVYYFDYWTEPSIEWLGEGGECYDIEIGKGNSDELWQSIFDFLDDVTVYDITKEEYWNKCIVDVNRNGSYDITYDYKPELDVANKQEIIDSIGQDLYDKYQQEDQERREAAEHSLEESGAEPENTPESPVYTMPELLGFIVEELSQDIPPDWQQLKIVAEVFEEQGKQAVSTVYAHHTGNEEWHSFSATNAFGPMNAVLKLQQLMQQDGQAWSRATLIFSSDGSVSIQSD